MYWQHIFSYIDSKFTFKYSPNLMNSKQLLICYAFKCFALMCASSLFTSDVKLYGCVEAFINRNETLLRWINATYFKDKFQSASRAIDAKIGNWKKDVWLT